MVIIAMTLYLPQHIAFLTNRAWFYYHGDEEAMVYGVKSVIENAVTTSTAIVGQVKETLVKASVDSTVVGAAKEL
ncbi:hypothetical protein BP6252_01522 [Coleophoma cylindrospora]|uniref:Uncharacterized protein n=1 Tax=Coleophoma cylindrospora TaxID=1849047 RepID=A0A3D8ST50_9HELO|nr:hypothetical protein BP6252_01522 [Coleophoma cylindrospora]